MSAVENKALARRFVEEVWNKGNMAVADELFASDFDDHRLLPGLPPGAEGYKQNILQLRKAFPDLHVTVEDLIAEGDKVVTRATVHGTHTGELMARMGKVIPPTSKQVTWTGITIARVVAGKATDFWVEADQLGLMQQLGVIPAPGQAAR